MTSNVGASEIAKNAGLGFTVTSDDETGVSYADMKTRIMSELKKVFRPEFLNRIDEVIVFHKLQKEEIKEIVELLMLRIRETMADRELSLNLSDAAKDVLVEKGWDPSMGARPLRRAIQRYIEDPLADEVLRQGMDPGSTVDIDKDDAEADPKSETEVNPLKITIRAPKKRKREAVSVGGGSGDIPEGEAAPEDPDAAGGDDLPEDPEVLPEVPDTPPDPEASSEK
jgi:ATP-dependent Clp protease ATP-binding subunit ClpC